ncbi:MAG: hypothetical protein KC473_06030, partial [Candidatus Dadabacteria bacterium]|nr:hypothetical protein [Candidatus Dadabacteria bacterium]
MKALSRIIAGISLVVLVSVLSTGGCSDNKKKPDREEFLNPVIIHSQNGVIDEVFDVIFSENEVNGKSFVSAT